MGKNIVRVTSSRKGAIKEKDEINASLKSRGIKREAYVCEVSKSYVKKLTREGYPIAERNYAICMRNIPSSKKRTRIDIIDSPPYAHKHPFKEPHIRRMVHEGQGRR